MISKIWPNGRGKTSWSYLVYRGFIEHVLNEFPFLLRRKLGHEFFAQKNCQNIKHLKGRFDYHM